MIAPFCRSSAISGESTLGTSIAKFTSLPPGAPHVLGVVPVLERRKPRSTSGARPVRDCARIAGPTQRPAPTRRVVCETLRKRLERPGGSGPADGARSNSPLQVTERSPRMFNVSSALSCPASGMPTRMPVCNCTLGSETDGSIRPNSNGGPVYCSKSGNTLEPGTVAVGYWTAVARPNGIRLPGESAHRHWSPAPCRTPL